MTIHEADRDLGTVWASGRCQRELRLENRSFETVEILELTTRCACAWVTPKSLAIPARTTAKVQLTLDLGGNPPPVEDNAAEELTIRIIATLRTGRPSHISWPVRARLRRALVATPARVIFDTELTKGLVFPAKLTKIRALLPLKSLAAECDEALATVYLTQQDKDVYALSIRPSGNLPLGPFEFSVKLAPELPSGEKPPYTRVLVAGTVWDEVEALPSPINLGGASVGSVLQGEAFVRSRVGKPFHVDSATPSSRDTEVVVGKSVNGGVVLTVRQPVAAGGHQQTSIRLTVRSGATEEEIVLPVIYYGLDTE